METPSQLADRLEEVLLTGRWIANTNYQEALNQLTWQQATHQVQKLNSIALITYHINYYIKGVLLVLQGEELTIKDKYSFDLQPITNQDQWLQVYQKLLSNAEQFVIQLRQMSSTQLNQDFVNPEYGTYRRNIEGMIEHCYYHLGQVVLLRKLAKE